MESKQSFYNWCVNNNRENFLSIWDYKLNDKCPKEIESGTSKKYYFKCPIGIHKSELKCISNITGKNRCNQVLCNSCNSFAQWCIYNVDKDFIEKYWSIKNIINPWELTYSSNKKVWIKCQEKDYHGSYEIIASHFIRGDRCPYCSGHSGKIHPLDSLGTLYPESLKYWSDKNEKSPYEYSPMSGKKVFWKCLDGKHEDFERRIYSSQKYEFRCPECVRERNESLLQEKVRLYITEKYPNYQLNHEYNCSIIPQNPKENSKRYQLPYDNEIIINNSHLIIEVNGDQHYNIHAYKGIFKHNNTTPEEEFHKQRLHDRYKRYVAYCNGYFYLEIPYWMDNKKEIYKKMIDNKIKEILKMQSNTKLKKVS